MVKRKPNLRQAFSSINLFLTNGLIASYRAASLPREAAKNLVC